MNAVREDQHMAECVLSYATRVTGPDRQPYAVAAWGEPQAEGTWTGWLEFRRQGPPESVLRTRRETTQPNREALVYWAEGLEPIYLEGALSRAA